MAYTAPTATEIKTRFVEFASVSGATIDTIIAEAQLQVDDTWLESDYKIALQFLVAHMLTVQGLATASPGAVASAPGPVTSERLGDASLSYGSRGGNAAVGSETDLSRTQYGAEFSRMRRANHPGVLIA